MAKTKTFNTGLEAPTPESNCEDKHCPFHAGQKLRGSQLVGTIVSSKVPKTATVEVERRRYLPKYERYEQRKSKVRVHNPPCINAIEGDKVRIVEARPISKTKRFIVVQKIEQLEQNESAKK